MKSPIKVNILIIIISLIVPLFFYASNSKCSEIITLNKVAPSSLLELDTSLKPEKGTTRISGSHGLERICFKTPDCFLVFEKNLLGEGYELNKEKPSDFSELQCQSTNEFAKNKMGLLLGATKQTIESKLGVSIRNSTGTIQWHSTQIINEKDFDIQTTLDLEFKDMSLIRLSVFTTTTY